MKSLELLYVLTLACGVLSVEYTVSFRSAYDQDLYESVVDPLQCAAQLRAIGNSSLIYTFLDASAKIPSGILGGNLNDLGDYYQCLNIHAIINGMEIEGKYAAIIIPLTQNITFPSLPSFPDIPGILENITWPGTGDGETGGDEQDGEELEGVRSWDRYNALRAHALGLAGFGSPVESRVFPMVITQSRGAFAGMCIPKVCDANQAINYYLDRLPIDNVQFHEYYYRLPNDKPFAPADYVAIVLFSLIGALLLISTSYDLHHTFVLKRDAKSANVLLRCFSIYTNTRRFLTFNTIPGAIECIDGIRSLSMMWVVVGHTYAFTLLGYIHNMQDAVMFLTDWRCIWINAAPITVDTFFMLSGLLAVYTTVGKISQRRFIRTVHLFYINRLLRMFPILAAVVLLQASLFNHVSDGPFWINMSQQAENCRKYWWSALLHVQNYVNPYEICIPQTWYLSVDVQLYFFCPIIMVWLFGKEKIAWLILTIIVTLSLVSSTTYSFLNNFSAALANPTRLGEFNQYVTTYYINTLTRAPPFFIGMVYGYILYLCKDKQVRITKMNAAILWMLALALMAFCIFSHYPVNQIDHTAQIFDNFLNAYMRAIWACALGWLIFSCVHGYGGPVNWFLSLQMWKLPARLSFAMYAVHLSIIMIANGSWLKTHYFSQGDNLYRFMSDISITFVVSFILCISIDAPFSTLQKLLLGGGKKPRNPKTESQHYIVETQNEPVVIKTTL